MTVAELEPPEETAPLRGLGPIVFISYSYIDLRSASRIAHYLRHRGMQVRMEDETSLLGCNLLTALPQRIGACEVFIQIVTEHSARSAWVAREFDWATSYSTSPRPPVVLPVVVDSTSLPDGVAKWGYLQTRSDLPDETLKMIATVALRAVHLLPLDPYAPYQADPAALFAYCEAKQPAPRVLLDPDGTVLEILRGTIQCALSDDVHHRKQIVNQQRRRYDRQLRRHDTLDAFLHGALQRVRAEVIAHWSTEDQLSYSLTIIQRFLKLTFGATVLDLVDDWPLPSAQVLSSAGLKGCSTAITHAEVLQRDLPSLAEGGRALWALEAEPGEGWLDLGFTGKPGIADGYVYLPASHFDEIGILSLRSGDSPAAEVTTTDWLTIGLPQVAARALHNTPTVDDVPTTLEHLGWSVRSYARSGPR